MCQPGEPSESEMACLANRGKVVILPDYYIVGTPSGQKQYAGFGQGEFAVAPGNFVDNDGNKSPGSDVSGLES
jgi:hypothetical protein